MAIKTIFVKGHSFAFVALRFDGFHTASPLTGDASDRPPSRTSVDKTKLEADKSVVPWSTWTFTDIRKKKMFIYIYMSVCTVCVCLCVCVRVRPCHVRTTHPVNSSTSLDCC